MKFIETLSEYVDRTCLDYVRYRLCDFYPVDSLPGRVGTLNSNPIFAAALLFDLDVNEVRIISGSVFSHAVVKGLGLPLEEINHDSFPKYGEVGSIS